MSPKSAAEKLLIKPGTSFWASDEDLLDIVGPLPAGVSSAPGPGEAATALIFADDAASLRAVLTSHARDLTHPDVLWVAYPKGNRTDVNRDSLWPILSEYGMRPVSQVALDDVWSALRFRALKPGETPFTGGR